MQGFAGKKTSAAQRPGKIFSEQTRRAWPFMANGLFRNLCQKRPGETLTALKRYLQNSGVITAAWLSHLIGRIAGKQFTVPSCQVSTMHSQPVSPLAGERPSIQLSIPPQQEKPFRQF